MKTIAISLGGSVIIPKEIDILFLKKLKKLVLNQIKKDYRFILVCGGGSICRIYQKASEKLAKTTSLDKDWIGIISTRLNAELIRVMFKDYAYPRVIYNPHKRIKTKKKLIIGAGYEPGCSTDTDTIILAKQFKANLVINATNIDYIYDKDPKKYEDAQKITRLTWPEYIKIIGTAFRSGMHAPFDPVASELAQKYKIKVAILHGKKLDNIKNLLNGKNFVGTLIG